MDEITSRQRSPKRNVWLRRARRTLRTGLVGLFLVGLLAAGAFADTGVGGNSTDTSTTATSTTTTTTTSTPTAAPSLATDQSSYYAGGAVGLSGSGFAANDTVNVTIADTASSWTSETATATVASDGTFTGVSIDLPATFASAFTATATDTTTGDSATATVRDTMPLPAPQFTPTVVTDQSDYSPGSLVTITGSGWPAGDSVTVVTNDTINNSWSQTDQVTAGLDGAFTDQVTLPDMFISNYTVTATDASGLSGETGFTDAQLLVKPGPAGQGVTFTVNWVAYTNSACTTQTSPAHSGSLLINLDSGVNLSGYGNATYVKITAPHDATTPSGWVFDDWSTTAVTGDTYSICVPTPSASTVESFTASYKVSDTTPPTVEASLHSPLPASGWFTSSPQQVDVSAYDPSGVSDIQCKVGTGSYSDASSQSGTGTSSGSPRTGTFSVSTEGNNAVTCQARDGASNTGAAAGSSNAVTVPIDTKPPTGGSVSVTPGYSASTTVPVSVTNATDPTPGSDNVTNQVQRKLATLSEGSCGSWDASWSDVTLDSGGNDTVASGNCAEYQLVSTDAAGNQATSDPSGGVMVDTSTPTISLSLSESDQYDHVDSSTNTVYYNDQGRNGGSFTVTATANDSVSGISKVNFPDVFTSGDGGNDSTSPYSNTYSWNATENVSGDQTVTAYSGADNTNTADFTLTRDTAPPTGGSVTYADGYNTTGTVHVTFTDATDSGSGIASNVLLSEYGTLSGGSCDFTGASWNPVTLDGSGNDTVASGTCAKYELVATDNVSNQATFDSSNVVKVDTSPPVDGAISVTPGYNTSGTVPVSVTPATDPESGIASNQVEKRTVTLSSGSCGDFSAATWTDVTLGMNGDDTVESGNCVEYQLVATDNAGLSSTYGPTDIVKVDTTPPTLSLTPSASDAYDYISGSTVYYNPNTGNSGSFTITATTSDPESGVDHVAFPNLFTGSDGGNYSSPYATTYSWSAGATASGTETVTSYDGADLSTDKTFTLTPDTTPPARGSITYSGGYYTTASVAIATTDGTDAGSGIDTSSGVIERAEATLSNNSCGTFGGYTTAVTLTSGNDTSVSSGHCYEYEYLISDHVSNQAAYTSGNVVKVDTDAPTSAIGFPTAGSTYTVAAYNAGCSTAGGDICGSATDTGGSGLASVKLQIQRSSNSEYWTGSTWTSNANTWVTTTLTGANTGSGTWSYGFTTVGGDSYTVTSKATDNAGNKEASPPSVTFTVQAATSLLYTGTTLVTLPTLPTLQATLTSAAASCDQTQPVQFTVTDSSGNPVLSTTVNTNASGIATATWPSSLGEGVYTVDVSFAGTATCVSSGDEATITVGSPGSKATGGGWTTDGGVGRVNFGFVVDLVPNTNSSTYKGQFVLVNPGHWRFKGTFGQAAGGNYVVTCNKTTGSCSGAGSGTGTVYYWNTSTLAWSPAAGGSSVSFTVSFTDNGSSTKKTTTPDTFGLNVGYDAPYNGYGTATYGAFPNFSPQAIKGGSITISGS